MSPIGQRNANGEAYFSQQAGAEDNGNDPSLCRLGQKSNDGNNLTPGAADDNSNQQGSILEKALMVDLSNLTWLTLILLLFLTNRLTHSPIHLV